MAFTEDQLVEQPAIQFLTDQFAWQHVNCYSESFGEAGTLGRASNNEVVLRSKLSAAVRRLNPELLELAVEQVVEEVSRDRSAMSSVEANREVYQLVKEGVRVKITDPETQQQEEVKAQLIDWKAPANNDFFLASQLTISGTYLTKRPDVIGFVNGLPLVLMEFKKPSVHVREGFDKNLTDYKESIPQLFHFNALLLVSNGVENKVGSLTSPWEHFNDWKKASSEEELPAATLENMLSGTCEPSRLLDLVENYTLFSEKEGAVSKLVARNHQFLGVNRAVDALEHSTNHQVGVFWHTQGSGKSYSMVFFAEKVFRKLRGNWTFVVITDRKELDKQIYRTFAACGAATDKKCHASSSANLKALLRGDNRYVFTLIHKFNTNPGEAHPVLSERDDIIVFTDEAHRSQYDTLAMNMRTALPNAKFVAFTGTPLITGEERTREVFGDYVSVYDFKQSVDDGATVPLFYENRTPELEIENPELNQELYDVIEEAELDEDQEEKLEKVLGRKYHLITRNERLDSIAKDIVHHFLNRGYQGKAMVISIDKLTAVKMYTKVKHEWDAETARVGKLLEEMNPNYEDYPALTERYDNLTRTDMAVIVSPGQNEISEMAKHGLDMRPHRERIVKEDLETEFKKTGNDFRIAFVCSMWLTGFDAPDCSTLYLDKPMRGHTLMQTIARANRVNGEKNNGLIVDYANVFQELEKALAIYGSGSGGGELPVKDKQELRDALKLTLEHASEFCRKQSVLLDQILGQGHQAFFGAVNQLLRTDAVKDEFLARSNDVKRLYKAVMPDPIIPDLAPSCQLIDELAKAIRATKSPTDISKVMADIETRLDGAVTVVAETEPGEAVTTINLSEIDFVALEKKFSRSKTKNTEAQKLRALVEQKLDKLIRLNSTRYDYLDRFLKMIEAYNSGAKNIEELFTELVSLSQDLSAEEHRHMRENLSEEELAVFDILTRPGPELSDEEQKTVKMVCKEMLATLKTEKLVLDWKHDRTNRAAVKIAIETMLDAGLPTSYTIDLFERKCGRLYEHILLKYPQQNESVYMAG